MNTSPSKSSMSDAVSLQWTNKLIVLVSAKGHPQGARTMDEDIDMETSAEMKQADMGEDVDMETTEAKIADEGNEDETMGADGGV